VQAPSGFSNRHLSGRYRSERVAAQREKLQSFVRTLSAEDQAIIRSDDAQQVRSRHCRSLVERAAFVKGGTRTRTRERRMVSETSIRPDSGSRQAPCAEEVSGRVLVAPSRK
jgi:hypothetical protein